MPAPDSTDVSADAGLRRATLAVYAVFFGAGFAFASWASRIPQVRDGLHLSPGSLGLLLLSIAAGSVMALPLAGMVVARLGAARTIVVMALLTAVGLSIAAIGYRFGVTPVVVGLFLLGVGNGTWDVAMNVEGAFVEQQLGRSIMPRFHAGFSIGTVTGALLGAGMVLLSVSVTVHLLDRRRARRGHGPVGGAGVPHRDGPLSGTARVGRSSAGRLERAAHAPARPARVLHGIHGGDGQRLARRGRDRRLPRLARRRVAHARRVPRRNDDRPLVRARAARSLRPCRERARLRDPRLRGLVARGLRRDAAARHGRRGAVGARERAGVPRRHERRGRRQRARRRAPQRRHVDRLHGVPRRPAVGRAARQPRRDAALLACGRRARERRSAGVGHPQPPAAPAGMREGPACAGPSPTSSVARAERGLVRVAFGPLAGDDAPRGVVSDELPAVLLRIGARIDVHEPAPVDDRHPGPGDAVDHRDRRARDVVVDDAVDDALEGLVGVGLHDVDARRDQGRLEHRIVAFGEARGAVAAGAPVLAGAPGAVGELDAEARPGRAGSVRRPQLDAADARDIERLDDALGAGDGVHGRIQIALAGRIRGGEDLGGRDQPIRQGGSADGEDADRDHERQPLGRQAPGGRRRVARRLRRPSADCGGVGDRRSIGGRVVCAEECEYVSHGRPPIADRDLDDRGSSPARSSSVGGRGAGARGRRRD